MTFAVGAVSFNPPLRYQWRFNGEDIAGATNSSLSFTNVQLAHAGSYSVAVVDSVGAVTSLPATLTALVTPQLTLVPPTQFAPTGAVITVNAAGTGQPSPFSWEWRRGSNALLTNTGPDRFNFLSFLNTNAVGSTQQYRVILRSISGQATAVFNVITQIDSDGDGIPDAWEQQFFGGANAANAALDDDGDGASNRAEYFAGTNPTNATSFLRLDLSLPNGQPTVLLGAESNKTYTVQFNDDLNASAWSKLADVFARTNSRVETIPDPTSGTNRFYRVVTPRQP